MHNRIEDGQNNTLKTSSTEKKRTAGQWKIKNTQNKIRNSSRNDRGKTCKIYSRVQEGNPRSIQGKDKKATDKNKVKHVMENKTGWEPEKRQQQQQKHTQRTAKKNPLYKSIGISLWPGKVHNISMYIKESCKT